MKKEIKQEKEIPKRKNKFGKIVSIIVTSIIAITMYLLFKLNILPNLELIIISIVLLFFLLITNSLLLSKYKKRNFFGTILAILLIIGSLFVIKKDIATEDFLKLFNANNYNTETFSVWVLDSSSYQNITDLEGKNIVSLKVKTEGLKLAETELKNKVNYNSVTVDDYFTGLESLTKKKNSAILIENAQIDVMQEEDESVMDGYRKITEFSVNVPIEENTKKVDITKKNFNIFISGIDSYGSINSVSRSDVNMILTVNPNTHEVLMTSIPRDYYVTLGGINEKDKLTHAGLYGIDTSVKTVENLLSTDINYYFKVNFTSVETLVDALGGITVNSPYTFISNDGYHYKKGENNLNGKEALSFARERKAFADGDNQRIKDQQLVVEAIIKKLKSKTVIDNYEKILSSLNGKFVTNLDQKDLTDFIKKQIHDMPDWTTQSSFLEGTNSSEYTYSYKKNKLYVMLPKEESITTSSNLIKEKLNS